MGPRKYKASVEGDSKVYSSGFTDPICLCAIFGHRNVCSGAADVAAVFGVLPACPKPNTVS
uniref:Uncharacterized protein n=1 Tax=Anguilla anguilla TaxID=7936 RepID=A0A0E9X8V3_ANGAN